MAGLGLSDAVRNYQHGVQFSQQQEQLAVQKEQQQRQLEIQRQIDEANKAATGVIEKSKAEWAMNGAQGNYTPNETTMFRAAEAKQAALAKAGLWDHYMAERAKVAPMMIQARAKALQMYEADGDPVRLALNLGPTFFDGKDVTGAEKITDDGANGPPGPARMRIKFSDGTDQEVDVEKMAKAIKVGMQDPAAWVKSEAMKDMERFRAETEVDKQRRITSDRGAEARKTASHRSDLRLGEQDNKADNQLGLIEEKNAGAERVQTIRKEVSEGRNAAMVDAARGRERVGSPAAKERAAKDPAVAGVRALDGEIKDARDRIKLNKDRAASSKDKEEIKRLEADTEAQFKAIDEALKKRSSMRRGGASSPGLDTVAPDAMGQARDEAMSSGQPVEFNLGGKRGTIAPSGSLADAAPAKPAAKPTKDAKPTKPAKDDTPPVDLLKAGVRTKFRNGQVWTLQGGKPVRVN